MSTLVPFVLANPGIAQQLRGRGVTWERALLHFTKSALRGNPIDLEHAQRTSSLFCQGGSSQEGVRWNRLLRCENVPFCTTQLSALVHHSSWIEVQHTLMMTAFPWQPRLAEAAMTSALHRLEWRVALSLVKTFPELGNPTKVRLADCPTNKSIACAMAFGLRSAPWELSIALCLSLGSVCSLETSVPLSELALLKLSQRCLASTRGLVMHLPPSSWTATVLRVALRVALADRNVAKCVELVQYGERRFPRCLPRFLLSRVVDLAIDVSRVQKLDLISLRNAIMYLGEHDVLLRRLGAALIDSEELTTTDLPSLMSRSFVNVNENISLLLRVGQWQNALAVAEAFNLPSSRERWALALDLLKRARVDSFVLR